jgi:predicted phosphoribosyltransferase
MNQSFQNRADAGRRLARRLEGYAGRAEAIVLGLPRGGVEVAFEVAIHLGLPLDVFIVRKLGLPGYEELALGAIGSGGVRVVNQELVQQLPNAAAIIETVAAKEEEEIERREREYRAGQAPLELSGRTVILVDDGVATGATMRAAVTALRQRNVDKIIGAVPAGSAETCREFEKEVDEMICLMASDWFHAVGQYYEDFSQVTDDEVRRLLAAARSRPSMAHRVNSR